MKTPAVLKRLLGRRACSWCGFKNAHVRQNEGKRPYVYCPHCGLQTTSKNDMQAELIVRGMRPEGGATGEPGHVDVVPRRANDINTDFGGLDELPPAKPAPAPVPPPPPTPQPEPKKPAGLWDTLMGKKS
jgi:DNA-directed RNA polymerase subunit RPC12/RpoP